MEDLFNSLEKMKAAFTEVQHQDLSESTLAACMKVDQCKAEIDQENKRNHCNSPLCPSCSGTSLKRISRKLLKKFQEAGIQESDISFVTVNSARTRVGDDLTPLVKADKKTLKYRLDSLRSSSLKAWFHFQYKVQSDHVGLAHWHGIIAHPGFTRDEIKAVLKKSFPDDRSVKLKPLYRHQTLAKNLEGIACYSGRTDTSDVKSAVDLIRYIDGISEVALQRQSMILAYHLNDVASDAVSEGGLVKSLYPLPITGHSEPVSAQPQISWKDRVKQRLIKRRVKPKPRHREPSVIEMDTDFYDL